MWPGWIRRNFYTKAGCSSSLVFNVCSVRAVFSRKSYIRYCVSIFARGRRRSPRDQSGCAGRRPRHTRDDYTRTNNTTSNYNRNFFKIFVFRMWQNLQTKRHFQLRFNEKGFFSMCYSIWLSLKHVCVIIPIWAWNKWLLSFENCCCLSAMDDRILTSRVAIALHNRTSRSARAHPPAPLHYCPLFLAHGCIDVFGSMLISDRYSFKR